MTFKHFFLIGQFELQRLFTTRKGLLYLVTFSVVWLLILLYPIRIAADYFSQSQMTLGSKFFEFIGLESLFNWQVPEFGVYWRICLFLFPILSVLITADQTSSDRDRGTLRFLTLRVSRDSLFFGRFFGAVTIQLLLIIVTLVTTLFLTFYREAGFSADAVSNALAIFVNLFIILLPFIALMATLSACLKSAKLAIVWAILILAFLSGVITLLSSYLPILDGLKFLIPGYQILELVQLSEWEPLKLAHISVIQMLVLLAIGRWVLMRQSL